MEEVRVYVHTYMQVSVCVCGAGGQVQDLIPPRQVLYHRAASQCQTQDLVAYIGQKIRTSLMRCNSEEEKAWQQWELAT